jgi:hypothetical protein
MWLDGQFACAKQLRISLSTAAPTALLWIPAWAKNSTAVFSSGGSVQIAGLPTFLFLF